MADRGSLDAGRKGKAVEHLVAASCILASDGHLNVSTSLVDDEGVDLVFHRRDTSQTLAVQVKSRFRGGAYLDRGSFMQDVRDETFRPRPDLHLLFVVVNAADTSFGPVWLVPSEFFAGRTKANSLNRRRFSASLAPDTQDQWRAYRLERPELAGRILSILDELP